MTLYRRYGKRVLDVAGAAAGLLLLAPLLLLVALAVKCGPRGPVFFRQMRVGRGGKLFTIWKFRSMVAGADGLGPCITASDDQRITGIGKWLRRRKLDELPQLWNVLKGDMSLVGPRPELPVYVRGYSNVQRQIFSVRPGITDPATLRYRDEEEALTAASDRELLYTERILPDKLRLNLEYIQLISLRFDLAIIFSTLRTIPRSLGPKTSIAEVHAQPASRREREEASPRPQNDLPADAVYSKERR
ncbi:MAG TPA: sugar transferase [Candidatus Saccharimonadales bacterium]|nr:sugar transferase [Candidatus Saccharimonadales bacterium]